ncbi:hypothetical protein BWI93_11635 [Siphonobacter sp. BAB-5385]|nr:hypothetical protein BWI93_11635 [Siphonobacter sp. BAB-5385]
MRNIFTFKASLKCIKSRLMRIFFRPRSTGRRKADNKEKSFHNGEVISSQYNQESLSAVMGRLLHWMDFRSG